MEKRYRKSQAARRVIGSHFAARIVAHRNCAQVPICLLFATATLIGAAPAG